MKLKGKVAVITGAASGIGKASALLFAAEGAAVAVCDIDEQGGLETVDLVSKSGGKAIFVRADVSKASDCRDMVAAAEEHFGAVNVVFNNAGIMHGRDDNAVTTEEDVWDLTMAINLKGVFLGCKYGIPALKRAGGGSVINTASFVAILGAATPQIAYTASKGGVLAMTRELAVVHARENIRVNALCPGPLHTELLMKFLEHRRKTATTPGAHSDGTLRRSGRNGPGGAFPGIGRRLLYHRYRLHGRRWHHGGVCNARLETIAADDIRLSLIIHLAMS